MKDKTMKKQILLIISLLLLPLLADARGVNRLRCGGTKNCENLTFCSWQPNCTPYPTSACAGFGGTFANCCGLRCCNSAPYCGPYPRPLPGQYDSFSDNTKINFWNIPPCAPRNDSAQRGYLYKGMWWDISGVRYWAFRNNTNNTITVEGLEGGEIKDIPAGDVTNINRGESYSFRVQAPARRFELFNSDAHNIEVFVNLKGDLDYRAEIPAKAKSGASKGEPELIMPKF
jgi:hypothetical protein